MHLSLSAAFAFSVACQLFLAGHILHFSKLQSTFVASLFARKTQHCVTETKKPFLLFFPSFCGLIWVGIISKRLMKNSLRGTKSKA